MSDDSDYSNNEMLALFIEESKEHLEVVEPSLLTMEEKGDDTDPEVINTVFRAIHSIKGSAGFFGLKNITELSHIMENLMAMVRDGSISTTAELINVLLKGLDKLEGMVEDVSTSDDVDVSKEIALIEAIMSGEEGKDTNTSSAETPSQQDSDKKGKQEEWNVEEYNEAREKAVANGHTLYSILLPIPDESGLREKAITEQIEFLSSIGIIVASRPDVSRAGAVKELAEEKTEKLELLFSTILERALLIDAAALSEENISLIDIKTESAGGNKEKLDKDNCACDAADAKKNKAVEVKEKKKKCAAPPSTAAAASEQTKKKDTAKVSTASDTVRVRVDLLDKIMALAGEIVLGRNQLLRQYSGRKNNSILIDHSQRVTELQENVMKTRLQPVGAVFNKFKRIVRDMARKVEKKINLTVEGEDVELDRSIIEVLSDPLTHMIRNSVDHAIESPEDRVKAGKAETGIINLRASHEGGLVIIEIEDDGRGIDALMIKEKAISKGLISEDEAKRMSEKELVNLIFHPGFSTVTEVSELSGRGVGMDVVKRSFEKLGSTIDLQSTPGKGTLFTVRLPLTLAILPSIIVTVGPNTFAIPQVDITEIVRIREKDLAQQLEYIEGQRVFRLRGKLLPVISLAKILEMREAKRTHDRADEIAQEEAEKDEVDHGSTIQRLIVMRYGANYLGLLVDTVLDPEEIVVKPMPHLVRSCKIFASATIMGDGHVAMILNLGGIIEKAGFRFESFEKATLQYEEEERKKAMQETQSIIIFKNQFDEYFGISLSMISRIEKIGGDDITSLAGKKFVNFRGKSIQLIFVEDYINKKIGEQVCSESYVIIPKTTGQIAGIAAEEIVDVIDITLTMDEGTIDSPVVIGSTIIEERMTLMIDVYTLLESVLPGRAATEKSEKTTTSRPVRILLVEDTPFFQNLERRYFESAGFNVTIASDGEAGLAMLQSNTSAFDIVISDIEMPVMNGYELVQAIRSNEHLAHLPVLALTSLNTEHNRELGMEAGFDAYEVKVDKDSLVNRVHELLRNKTQTEAVQKAVGA